MKTNKTTALNEAQKDALRAAYDTVVQLIRESTGSNHEYNQWVNTANGLLRAGGALGFDLYADYDARHKSSPQRL